MKPAYTIIEHVDSRRSLRTPEGQEARRKGIPFISRQFIREFPREVDLKRAERARKKAERAKAKGIPAAVVEMHI